MVVAGLDPRCGVGGVWCGRVPEVEAAFEGEVVDVVAGHLD
jgi:hypothetical protein